MRSSFEEIEKYLLSLNSKNRPFVMGSLEEEKKYVYHNKERFAYALDEADRLLRNIPEPKILDIGTSPFTFILKKRYSNAKIYTIDYSNKFKNLCRLKGINLKKFNLEKGAPTFGKVKFELITFLEVLEHLRTDHLNIINTIARLLNKNGYCILQTPNKFSPKSVVVKIITEKVWRLASTAPKYGEEFHHFKEYSLGELINLLRKSKLLKIIKYERPLYFDSLSSAVPYRKFPLLFLPLVLGNYVLVKKFPFLRNGMQVVFTRSD